MASSEFPTPLEIKALAEDYGYRERRPEASYTLFFQEIEPADPKHPINVNVFYTTRGIMTQLPHPKTGYNSLWRSSAYDSLTGLAMLFEDPRAHTGKGYRQAKDAVRGCAKCGFQKKRTEYSESQWKAGPGKSVCGACVSGKGKGGGGGGGAAGNKNKENGGSNKKQQAGGSNSLDVDGGGFPRLSEEALKEHDKKQPAKAVVKNEMERRQYNCPLCPKEGRGKHVFFKRVPMMKPVVKCPKCKRAKEGECERLYPIPRGEEKGYGKFRPSRTVSLHKALHEGLTVSSFASLPLHCAKSTERSLSMRRLQKYVGFLPRHRQHRSAVPRLPDCREGRQVGQAFPR